MRFEYSRSVLSVCVNALVAMFFFLGGLYEALALRHFDVGSFLVLCAIYLQQGYSFDSKGELK